MYWILVSLALGIAPLHAGPRIDLLNLGAASVGDRLPAGWTIRPVNGRPTPSFTIREEGGERVLRVHGSGAAAWAQHKLTPKIEEARGGLRWSWRVLQTPASADLRDKHTDDSALRLFVVFGKLGGPFGGGKGRIIFYTWGNSEPKGLSQRSFVSEKIHIVRVAGARDADYKWREQVVDPFADFRRFWDKEPPPITAVGIMQDTDMTGDSAVAELRALHWEPN